MQLRSPLPDLLLKQRLTLGGVAVNADFRYCLLQEVSYILTFVRFREIVTLLAVSYYAGETRVLIQRKEPYLQLRSPLFDLFEQRAAFGSVVVNADIENLARFVSILY